MWFLEGLFQDALTIKMVIDVYRIFWQNPKLGEEMEFYVWRHCYDAEWGFTSIPKIHFWFAFGVVNNCLGLLNFHWAIYVMVYNKTSVLKS